MIHTRVKRNIDPKCTYEAAMDFKKPFPSEGSATKKS